MSMLYAIVEGGLTPYQFGTTSATYPFVVRADGPPLPPIPPGDEFDSVIESYAFDNDVALRTRVVDALAVYGMYYEGMLVTGARPSDHSVFQTRGFVDDWAHGSVLVNHFVPCRLDVGIPPLGARRFWTSGLGQPPSSPTERCLRFSITRGHATFCSVSRRAALSG